MTFEEVVQRIVSTRSNWHWQHGGLVHLMGRAPDGKTECGLTAKLDEVYKMRPGKAEDITCDDCELAAPPPPTLQRMRK